MNVMEAEGVDTLAKIDGGTLRLLQVIQGSSRRLCRQMGSCSNGDNPCRKFDDSNPAALRNSSQTCDADMMRSRLEQSVRLAEIGRWAAELIHDIKHPTAAVSSAAQTLQNLPNMGGAGLRLATIIREEINHLNKLVDGLLDMVKPRQPQLVTYEVNELVERIMPVINGKISGNGNVVLKWRPDSKRAAILVDADQMQEVFANLATNALEAMRGAGTLSILAESDQDTVHIAFTDTGLGISEPELGLIFNPFYSTKMGGIGLGLSIVKRIVEDHDGYIAVISPAEAGATFTVTLPRQKE